VQAHHDALVLATHGRGIWILDDISALRALTPDVLAKDVALLTTTPVEERMETATGRSPVEPASSGRIHRRAPRSPGTSGLGTCSAS